MHKLFIDSRDIASGHSSNFQIGLVDNIVVSEQSYATIDKVLIPNSWYTITQANRIFYYVETESGTNHFRRGFFEPGNYTYADVAVMLERTLNYSRFVANPIQGILQYNHRTHRNRQRLGHWRGYHVPDTGEPSRLQQPRLLGSHGGDT